MVYLATKTTASLLQDTLNEIGKSRVTDAIDNLFASLTTQEKAQLSGGKGFWHLHGVERLNLPSIMVTDGPHGLRKQSGNSDHAGVLESVPATCFPTASALAATWSTSLIEEVGGALAKECLAQQVSVLLGPGANIKRHPLGGRNFEYFSEDPHVTGKMASAWIRGLQRHNVGASLKHYALNNHERGRMVVDVVTDERTLREIYLPGWETPVKEAQPWTIMCAYNKFRGTYLSENEYLLKTVLRQEWGFKGVVVTDWMANHKRVDGVRNGQSLEMPGSGDANAQKIIASVTDGTLTEEALDESVRPVVELIVKAADALDPSAQVDLDSNHTLARRVAEEACVLLKNEGGLLPLSADQEVAVIGALAAQTRYQGSGSSQINPSQLEQPLNEIRALAGAATKFAAGYLLSGKSEPTLLAEASTLAAKAQRIIVVVGLTPDYESEAFDRPHMQLPPNQLELLDALLPYHDRLVVVLQNGAPVELPFKDTASAILEAYLGGQAGASAMARILFGLANPSGKLAETMPIHCADVPSDQWFNQELRQAQYREGIWVGYRYFDSAKIPVAFPFGHGLSYTEFDVTELRIESLWQDGAEEGHVDISVNVTNTGSCEGAQTIQVYVGQINASVPRPVRELKAFSKVRLQPNETSEVTMRLDRRSFAFWCVQANAWVVESDEFQIDVGVSIADIRQRATIALNTGRPLATRSPGLATYFTPDKLAFDEPAFRCLLGHSIPNPICVRPYQWNSTLAEVRGNWLGGLVHKLVARQTSKMLGEHVDEHTQLMIDAILMEMPLRSLATMSRGKVSESLLRRLIHAMNGSWLKCMRSDPVRSE